MLATTTLAPDTRTRALLSCGAAAGPLFTTVALGQVLTRDGFDLTEHPLSLLSLGDLGWVQVASFTFTGMLSAAFAVGMARALPPGRGRAWPSWLYAAFGVGLVVGGLFLTDPVPGFPPGSTVEATPSWHSLVHDIAAGVSLDLALLSCLILARRFQRQGEIRWAAYSALTCGVGFVLSWWTDPEGISLRLAVTVVLILAWAASLALHLSGRAAVAAG